MLFSEAFQIYKVFVTYDEFKEPVFFELDLKRCITEMPTRARERTARRFVLCNFLRYQCTDHTM